METTINDQVNELVEFTPEMAAFLFARNVPDNAAKFDADKAERYQGLLQAGDWTLSDASTPIRTDSTGLLHGQHRLSGLSQCTGITQFFHIIDGGNLVHQFFRSTMC